MTQNGHQGRVGQPAPPSGAHDEPAAAAASAATTGPGPGPGPRLPEPALDLLAMLNRMQQSQQKQQQQQQQFQQQFQQQQQDILAALMQQLLPARQQAGPRPGPGDAGSLPASPPSPPLTPQLRARDLSSLPAHPTLVGWVTPRGDTYVYIDRHHPHGARPLWPAGGPQNPQSLPARARQPQKVKVRQTPAARPALAQLRQPRARLPLRRHLTVRPC